MEGGWGGGGGASVSEFFCYESKPKISDFFFLQRIQILKKKFAGWRGCGGGFCCGREGARVCDFYFTKNPYLKNKNFLGGGGGWSK